MKKAKKRSFPPVANHPMIDRPGDGAGEGYLVLGAPGVEPLHVFPMVDEEGADMGNILRRKYCHTGARIWHLRDVTEVEGA